MTIFVWYARHVNSDIKVMGYDLVSQWQWREEVCYVHVLIVVVQGRHFKARDARLKSKRCQSTGSCFTTDLWNRAGTQSYIFEPTKHP